ncbi:transmembrane and ubiquitin-like domain-containing protein 1 [Syngnathus acus]|uniref:transmembrane and ubiquitin-like domain-containing protein 1 n=1 Tax=Syngnathus acus TaxID=161584 RepID=UPI0018860011|nr:transmembrane and ubiquitin-like domain-containing protein 1 [Syngnathus acus]
MVLIEGVGDEVTLLLVALTAAAVLLLAWASTRTSEPPPPLHPASPRAASPPDQPPASTTEGPAPDGDFQRNMVLRLKFLNDTERTAHVKPQDTIGYIKRTYFAGQERHVRLIYQGQLLQDDGATLETLHLAHNCVLHCHVSSQRTAAVPVPPEGAVGTGIARVRATLNAGGLMVPLLGLALAVLWYCQIQYRHLFTAPASALLLGLTVFLSLLAFGAYRH